MIKLIASDVDGTLVKDGTLMINPEYMTVIHKLAEKGIIFVVCSGRQFASGRRLFAPIVNELYYISDGGTVVRTPDKILKTFPYLFQQTYLLLFLLYFFLDIKKYCCYSRFYKFGDVNEKS